MKPFVDKLIEVVKQIKKKDLENEIKKRGER